MSQRFVLNVENYIIEAENIGENRAWLSHRRVNCDDSLVVITEVELVQSRQHTIRNMSAKLLGAELEILAAEGGRDNRSRGQPDREHANTDVGRATDYLD